MMEKQPTLTLTATKSEARIDSRMLAEQLGSQHESLFKIIYSHQNDFEQLGKVRFQIRAYPGSRTGQKVKFALLSEDQAYLLLTYTRNSSKVRELKIQLVKAFRDVRQIADLRQTEYLPTYHRMHDEIHKLAIDSPNERHVHCNVNKLVNKTVGIEAGQRQSANFPQQSMLSIAQAIATQALQGAPDHRDGYQRVKRALEAFDAMTKTLRLELCVNGNQK